MSVSSSPPFWNLCSRVYFVWAAIVLIGFTATQFHQLPDINWLWLALSAIGLGYMGLLLLQPQNRSPSLLYTGLVWLLTIGFGLAISALACLTAPLAGLLVYLGSFWLFLMGIGHFLNGIVDPPLNPYLMSGGIQLLAGVTCLIFLPVQTFQYLVAGLVGAAAMIGLAFLRY